MKITVQAALNEGKTTVALLVADALAQAGLDVTVEDPDVQDLGTALADPLRPHRLGALRSKEGFNVVVATVQVPQDPGAAARAQCDRLRRYALVHKLVFKNKAQLVEEWGEEEWEGVQCAAFAQSPSVPGPVLALVTDEGVAKVLAFFAGDDPRWDTDKFLELEVSKLESAIKRRRRLHAE